MWIQTYTRKHFDVLEPTVQMIDIEDIAQSLSLICRFGGHCKFPYSVAQHSIYVWEKTGEPWGLMHDAAEAYIGDICRPVKKKIPQFKEIEDNILKVIAEKFGLPYEMPLSVHDADNRMLMTEAEQLLGGPTWNVPYKPYTDLEIKEWTPTFAKDMFLIAFTRIFPKGKSVKFMAIDNKLFKERV